MIKIDSNTIMINGDINTILSECTTILRKVYLVMVDALGEEDANSHLAMMGRIVAMTEEE